MGRVSPGEGQLTDNGEPAWLVDVDLPAPHEQSQSDGRSNTPASLFRLAGARFQ